MLRKSIVVLIFITIVYVLRRIINIVERRCLFQGYPCDRDVKVKKGVEELNINGRINALYYKHPKNDNRIVMYLHGNAGHIHYRTKILERFSKHCSFIMFDYRGYGKTPGSSTEVGVKEDAWQVWRYLRDIKGYKASDIVVYGNSLGSSIGTWLTKKLCERGMEKPRQLVIQAGFCNYREIVKDVMHPLLSYLCTISFDTVGYLKEIGDKVPVLIVHSAEDKLINIRHAKHLLDKNENAKFYEVTGDHNSPNLDAKYFEYFCANCL